MLPDHMYCVWTLPEADSDFSAHWKDIKIRFAKSLPRTEVITASMARRGERGIWQRRFWEHTIINERDYSAHIDYVHLNPVKHGLVERAVDWPYSTFHRYLKAGVYTLTGWSVADMKMVEGAALFHQRGATHCRRSVIKR